MPLDTVSLKKTIFQILLTSENRTTDLLEIITKDSLLPIIHRQEQTGVCLMRHSKLVLARSGLCASQNVVRIRCDAVPPALFAKLIEKRDGIGHLLRSFDFDNTRQILRFGFIKASAALDLLQRPYELGFNDGEEIPYKEYEITFKHFDNPGIRVLEYFNPHILNEVSGG